MHADDLTVEVVRRTASQTPDRLAIQDAHGARLSYGEVHFGILHWADAFTRAGVAKDTRVALMLATSAEAFVVHLAVGSVGGTVVALNTMMRGPLLSRALAVTGAAVMVTDSAGYAKLAECEDPPDTLRLIVVTGGAAGVDAIGTTRPARAHVVPSGEFVGPARPDAMRVPELGDIQQIVFTSGTSGPSKPVAISYEFALRCARNLIPGGLDAAGGSYYSPWSLGHSLGSLAFVAAADRGVSLALRDRFSTGHFWDDVRQFSCRTVVLVSGAAQLWAAGDRPDDSDNPLRYVTMSPLIPQYRDFQTRFQVSISTLYGATEIGPALISKNPGHYRVSGQPAPGYECRVVDSDGASTASGVSGELLVRHSSDLGLMSGYIGIGEGREQTLRDGWFHTGDLFICDSEGVYSFVDRLKDSIRRRGRNVSTFEVEAQALAHPAVAECAAVGVPVDDGHETPRVDEDIKLFVVLQPGVRADPPELVHFLDSQLPGYMVPRYIEFVEALPKTVATQRTVKIALRKLPNTEATYDRYAAVP